MNSPDDRLIDADSAHKDPTMTFSERSLTGALICSQQKRYRLKAGVWM
jgi:hypothetical protein